MICQILSILFLFSRSVWADEKPIAIIHIGPHKTGSSWLQMLLFYSLHDELQEENFYSLPVHYDGRYKKKASQFAVCLQNNSNFAKTQNCQNIIQKLEMELKNHLENKRNVILSAEDLSSNNADYERIKTIFSGFNIRIVFVYRELVNAIISKHNQNGKTDQLEPPIWELLSNKIKLNEMVDIVSTKKLIERVLKHFDRKQMFLFDYYGMINSDDDIAGKIIKIIFAEISENNMLKILEKTKSLKSHASYSNVKEELWVFEFYWFIKNLKNDDKIQNVSEKLEKSILERNNDTCHYRSNIKDCNTIFTHLPKKCVSHQDLENLKTISLEENKIINENYHDFLFYQNKTKNEEKIAEFKVNEEKGIIHPEDDLCTLDAENVIKNEKILGLLLNDIGCSCLLKRVEETITFRKHWVAKFEAYNGFNQNNNTTVKF